jgi:hypothetical protein
VEALVAQGIEYGCLRRKALPVPFGFVRELKARPPAKLASFSSMGACATVLAGNFGNEGSLVR